MAAGAPGAHRLAVMVRRRRSWFVLSWLVGCTSFGAEPTPAPDGGPPEAGAIADVGSDAPLDGFDGSLGSDADAGAFVDATPDGPRYTCATPVVVSSHTVPSDCDRALADSGCPKGAPPEGKPCAGGSVDPDVTSCACEGGDLRRTTCTCR
jgi:hypothetical protein